MKIAILVIAAGASRRLGQPKQLLPYKDTILLDYVIKECQASEVGDVYLVLGANRKQIEAQMSGDFSVFYHQNWKEGMGTSIAFGIQQIDNQDYEGVIVCVGDQPFFRKELLRQIVKKRIQTNAPVIISKFKEGMGPPSFFEKSLFSELAQLKGDIGAKPIVKKYSHQKEIILFENGHIDIDAPDDLKYLKEKLQD